MPVFAHSSLALVIAVFFRGLGALSLVCRVSLVRRVSSSSLRAPLVAPCGPPSSEEGIVNSTVNGSLEPFVRPSVVNAFYRESFITTIFCHCCGETLPNRMEQSEKTFIYANTLLRYMYFYVYVMWVSHANEQGSEPFPPAMSIWLAWLSIKSLKLSVACYLPSSIADTIAPSNHD